MLFYFSINICRFKMYEYIYTQENFTASTLAFILQESILMNINKCCHMQIADEPLDEFGTIILA